MKSLELFLKMSTVDKSLTILILFVLIPFLYLILHKLINNFQKKILENNDKLFKLFCQEFRKEVYHPCQSKEFRKVQDSLIENIADNQKDFEKIMQQLTFIIDSSKSEKYDFFSRIDRVINEIDMIKNNSKNFNDVLDKIKEFLIEVNNEIKNIRRG